MSSSDFMKESNVFGDNNSSNNVAPLSATDDSYLNDFLGEGIPDSVEDRLLFKNYSIIRLMKEGDFLTEVLDKKEITSNFDKLLRMCVFMNLSSSMISYVHNILDVALSLSAGNNNINHLNVLVSVPIDDLKNLASFIGFATVTEDLLTSNVPNSEEYNLGLSKLYSFKYKELLKEEPISLIVGGACFSKLMKMKELSDKVLQLNYDACKDLRFVLENKHPISLESYNDVCCKVIDCNTSLLKQFEDFVESIVESVSGCFTRNDGSKVELGTMDYLNSAKSLVDHFRFLDDHIKHCERVTNQLNSVRKMNRIDSRRTNLIKIDFKVDKV